MSRLFLEGTRHACLPAAKLLPVLRVLPLSSGSSRAVFGPPHTLYGLSPINMTVKKTVPSSHKPDALLKIIVFSLIKKTPIFIRMTFYLPGIK